MVYSFQTVVIKSILQKMNQFEVVKFEFSSRKIFNRKHITVLSMFEKKLCYDYNHLGAILFEHKAGVTGDDKFAGSMAHQSTQIVLMVEWSNDSLCCEVQREIYKVNTFLFYFYFL